LKSRIMPNLARTYLPEFDVSVRLWVGVPVLERVGFIEPAPRLSCTRRYLRRRRGGVHERKSSASGYVAAPGKCVGERQVVEGSDVGSWVWLVKSARCVGPWCADWRSTRCLHQQRAGEKRKFEHTVLHWRMLSRMSTVQCALASHSRDVGVETLSRLECVVPFKGCWRPNPEPLKRSLFSRLECVVPFKGCWRPNPEPLKWSLFSWLECAVPFKRGGRF
jgi:hypothetical protein